MSPLELARAALLLPGGAEFCRQLAWRDFFHQVTAAFPDMGSADYRPGSRGWAQDPDPDALDAWRAGRTGIPIVDAGLRQLAAEGFMHNRARMITASFLTRTLGIDWRHGYRHFAGLLADGDVANNAGNWQWVAGTGNSTRPGRVLNPLAPGGPVRPARRLRAPVRPGAGRPRRAARPHAVAAARGAARAARLPRPDHGGPGVIEKIVPATVACAEAFTDLPGAGLFPQEEALLAGAAAARRREFATARSCARTALAELGVTPAPVLRGERGEPRWPPGFVGSITHCAGYRAAAVARAMDVLAIGVDAEPGEPLPDGVLDIISVPGERERLRRLAAAAPGTCWDRLLFSAKESVYKAWFPLTGRWLGFEDADVNIDPGGTFGARLLTATAQAGGFPLTGFAGRWLASGGLIVTAVTVPPPAAAPGQEEARLHGTARDERPGGG